MNKKIEEILNKAKAMNNPDLADAIEALEFLGGGATDNNQEYNDLVEMVAMVEDDKPNSTKTKTTTKPKTKTTTKPKTKTTTKQKTPAEKYKGVKRIGAFWFNSKDRYRKKFITADECADHFNK